MRIIEVNIPSDIAGVGLSDIKMKRLGQVVLLAGKNGAGKSRIIESIQKHLKEKPTSNDIIRYKDVLEGVPNVIKNYQNAMSDSNTTENQKRNLEKAIRNQEKALESAQTKLEWNYITTDSEDADIEKYEGLKYNPSEEKLRNPNSENRGAIRNQAEKAKIVGLNNIHNTALCKIQNVQDKWYEVTHPNSTATQEEEDYLIAEYSKLELYIKTFLNTNLGRNVDADATIFGLPIGEAMLSDGQTALLKYCIALYAHGGSLDNTILFMDEPEKSLHPLAIIELVDKIKECVPNGQIWIATHSLPLLAHFDPNSIWYVEDGSVSHAGKIPEKVLESLLGDEDERGKLLDFISLPSILALNRHAYESLLPPQVVDTGKEDPQTTQIGTLISEAIQKNGKVKILDFGAGKGRLLSNYIENNQENLEDLKVKLDYIAYDEYDSDKDDCTNNISELYGSADKRYFNKLDDLLSVHDKESFDIVVMCNVLHEIDVRHWRQLFEENGKINQLLADNGYLLLVEDQEMPVGEKAYQKGFLVLNTVELKELFSIEGEIECNRKYDGRLTAHAIPKSSLSNITTDTIKAAVTSVNKKACDKIMAIRSEDTSYKNGQKHGFWVEQLANSQLILNEI